jgi:hypothetical protein
MCRHDQKPKAAKSWRDWEPKVDRRESRTESRATRCDREPEIAPQHEIKQQEMNTSPRGKISVRGGDGVIGSRWQRNQR